MKVYLATWLYEEVQGEALTKHKCKHRLISFHFLKKQQIKVKELKTYITTGIHRIKKKS